MKAEIKKNKGRRDLKQSSYHIIENGYRKMEGHPEVMKVEIDVGTETFCKILNCR